MRRLALTVLALVSGLVISMSSVAKQYVFDKPKFSLGGVEEVVSFHQDARGAMWLINIGVIYRFDGKTLEEYRHDPDNPASIAAGWSRHFFNTKDGRLWNVTDGVLQVFDYANRVWSKPEIVPDGVQLRWAGTSNGRTIWLQTEVGDVFILDPLTNQIRQMRLIKKDGQQVKASWSNARFSDSNNGFYVWSQEGGFAHVTITSNDEVLESPLNIIGDQIFSADVLSLGFDASSHRLVAIDVEATPYVLELSGDDATVVPNSLADMGGRAWASFIDSEGLWLLMDRGIYRCDVATITCNQLVTSPDIGNAIFGTALFRSLDGIMWVASYQHGILTGMPIEGEVYNASNSPVPKGTITAITTLENGAVAVANEETVAIFDPDTRALLKSITLEDVPALRGVKPMTLLARGRQLFIGTYASGLIRYDLATDATFTYPLGAGPTMLNASGVVHITEHSTGALIVLTYGGGVSVINGETVYTPSGQNFGDRVAFDAIETERGVLIVLSDKAFRVENDLETVTELPIEFISDDGTPGSLGKKSYIWDVFHAANGRIFAGSSSAGLLEIQEEHDNVFISQIAGRATNSYGVLPLGEKLYVLSDAGILEMSPDASDIKVLPTYYGMGNLVYSSQMNVASKVRDEIFVATRVGIIRHRDIPDFGPPPAVQVGVSSMQSSNGTYLQTNDRGELTLPADHQTVTVSFFAAEYLAPERITNEFRIVGYDEQWSQLSGNSAVTITGLDPGTYRLELATTGASGERFAPSLTLPIVVSTPLWKTAPFIAAYIGVVLVIIAFVVRLFRQQVVQGISIQRELKAALQTQARQTEVERIRALTADDALTDHKSHLATVLGEYIRELKALANRAGRATNAQERAASIAGFGGAVVKLESRLEVLLGMDAISESAPTTEIDEPEAGDNSAYGVDVLVLIDGLLESLSPTYFAPKHLRVRFIGDAQTPEGLELAESDLLVIVELLLVAFSQASSPDGEIVLRLGYLQDDLIVSCKEMSSSNVDRLAVSDYLDDAKKRTEAVGGLFSNLSREERGQIIQVELPAVTRLPREIEVEERVLYATEDPILASVLTNSLIRGGYQSEKLTSLEQLDPDGDIPLIIDAMALPQIRANIPEIIDYAFGAIVITGDTSVADELVAHDWSVLKEPLTLAALEAFIQGE